MEDTTSEINILLDSSIRDWVVLPLLIIMIMSGLLRTNLQIYLRAKSKPMVLTEIQSKSNLQRVSRLRCGGGGGSFLGETKWLGRKQYYIQDLRRRADLLEAQKEEDKKEEKPDEIMPGMDPASMMDSMKGGMAGMVQNMVMMQGISHFFKGFVLLKVPFPLTNGFKGMFQRGLDLTTLDTSYVSSVSWYFLVMYGLRGFFRLVMAPDASPTVMEDAQSAEIQASLGNSMGATGKPTSDFDGSKAFRQQADSMEVALRYFSTLDDAEKRLLGKRYPVKKKKISVNRHNPGDDIFGFNTSSNKSKSSGSKSDNSKSGVRRRRKH